MKFEISIDDNHPDNEISLKLLESLGMKATFFLPFSGLDRDFVARALKAGMEIGGHSVTHPEYLRKLEPPDQWREIKNCKTFLEETGAVVTKFAYPSGKYDDLTVELVKRAGYAEARDTNILATSIEDPFRKRTTIHVFDGRKEYKGKGWLHWAQEIFATKPSYFHIWWHSWEVDKRNQWRELQMFLINAKKNLPS